MVKAHLTTSNVALAVLNKFNLVLLLLITEVRLDYHAVTIIISWVSIHEV